MNSIKTAFLHLWAFFTDLGAKELAYVESTVIPVLKADAEGLFVTLAPVALSIVSTLATTGTVSNDKRDTAVAQVKAAAIAAGLSASTSVLNKLVEDAVSQLKATTATTASTASSAS